MNDRYSDEAHSDEDEEEIEAFDAESPTDPATIESIVGEGLEGDVAVILPARRAHGSIGRDDVDGTDLEAIFDEENREIDNLEAEMSEDGDEPPDLFELGEAHHSD